MSGASEKWVKDGQVDSEALIPALRSFLGLLIRETGLELRADIRTGDTEQAERGEASDVLVDFHGRDAELLLERRAELLQALEHLSLRWLQLGRTHHDRIRFDCQDYKANRIAELRLAAQTAAERVKHTRSPFRFQPMDSRERRILHLALRDDPAVRTVSEGERHLRGVVVYPA